MFWRMGFFINNVDKCVHAKINGGKEIIICSYVDDMLMFGTNFEQVKSTKGFLSLNFDTKDLGEADVILGIKISRHSSSLVLPQYHYIEKVLRKLNNYNCKPLHNPFHMNMRLEKNVGNLEA